MVEEYEESGSLVTDKREIATGETWESQSDWEAYQSINNVEIENGIISLSTFEPSLIPDSGLQHDYDATALTLNDGDSVDTLPDNQGSNDLSGSGTFDADGINGQPAVFYDGSESHSSTVQPFSSQYSIHIVNLHSTTSQDAGLAELSSVRVRNSPETDERNITHSGEFNSQDGVATTNPEVWSVRYGDQFSTTPDFRVNGVDEPLNDGGGLNTSDLTEIGASTDGAFNGHIGRVLVYDIEQSDNDFTTAHDELLDQFSIST